MAFAPSNQIRLRHVPFDDTYRHVFDFGSSSAQFNYFNGLAGYNFNNFTYQRKDDIIRVPVNAESLYNINYVMYQNANFGDKWFYAFVTKIEYVNDNTSFLHIKTDVWQTWLFNWSIDQCFVERMHAPYDTLGEWEEPEPLVPEAYPREAYRLTPQTDFFTQTIILYFSKIPPSLSDVVASQEDSGALSATYQKTYAAGGGGLPAFQECMADLALLETAGEMELISGIGTGFTSPFIPGEQTFDFVEIPSGGVAKNNKTLLYCYGLIVGNSTYKVDIANCKGRTFNYIPRGNFGSNPSVSVEVTTFPHVVIDYSGFPSPRLPINSDINQISRSLEINMKTLPFQMISGALGAAGSMVQGGSGAGQVVGSLLSPLQSAVENVGQMAVSDIMPKQLSGYAPTTGLFASGNAGIWLIKYYPNRDEFNRIDNFFSAFGYAVNDIRHPIIKISDIGRRANFNYIKTRAAALIASGGIVQEDYAKICQILDSGVTVWHNPGAYGNELIANDPV